MTLTGKARVAGIIGWPVTHSLSPVLHGHWLKEYGIDGAMVPLAARQEDFAAVIDGVRRAGFVGVNVTVPHKEAAFALAHRLDDAARSAGAANLLIFHDDGTIEGRNTDSIGLAESLRENIGALDGKTVVLLGAGGAARGAIFALDSLGADTIRIVNRSPDRARDLATSLAKDVKKAKLVALDNWASAAEGAALIANTTSAGMSGQGPLNLDLSVIAAGSTVLDIVYSPLETKLLKDAAARGLQTIDGLGMLMHQAAPSFEAFFGVRPQVTPALRAALEKVLRERQ